MKKKKILHVFSKLDRGGAEMSTLKFLQRNHDSVNYEFHFWLTSGKRGNLDEEYLKASNGGLIHYQKLNFRMGVALFKFLRSEKIDVIHSHLFVTSGIFVLIGWLAGTKHRFTHIRSSSNGEDTRFLKRIQTFVLKRLCLLFSTKILSVSNSAAKKVFGSDIFLDKRYKTLYNGFELNSNIDCSEKRKFIIGHVGRFHKAKNHNFMVNIILDILNRHDLKHNITFVFVGNEDTDIAPKFRTRLKKFIDAGQVEIKGVISNVNEELSRFDLFLFPSLWEGLPGALLEALASGIPILASTIDPVLEIKPYFSQLNVLSLNNGHNNWANSIVDMSNGLNLSENSKELTLNEFVKSPFYFINTDNVYINIYND